MSAKAKENKQIRCEVPDSDRCRFSTTDGRRCANPHMGHAAGFCVIHEARMKRVDEAEVREIADQLFSDCANLQTRGEVNSFMAKLLKLVAEKRISREDGGLLAYIASLLLQTIAPVRRSKPVADERDVFMDRDSFASPIHDVRPEIERNVGPSIPATREEFARKLAERFGQEQPMPGRTYNPYLHTGKIR